MRITMAAHPEGLPTVIGAGADRLCVPADPAARDFCAAGSYFV